MLLRKINAWISLATAVLLVGHAMLGAIEQLSRHRIPVPAPWMSSVLMGLMITHAMLSIMMVLSHLEEAGERRYRTYPNQNSATYAQRLTGVLMILLFALHYLGASNGLQSRILHAILHPLFYAVVFAHTGISTNKALITLGFGNAKAIRVIGVVVRVICVTTLIVGVSGLYVELFAEV